MASAQGLLQQIVRSLPQRMGQVFQMEQVEGLRWEALEPEPR